MGLTSPRTIFSRQAGLLACLVVFSALLPPQTQAQSRRYRPPARYVQLGSPDQAEGRKIIENFRLQGIAGDYYFEFDLKVLPRKGDTQVISGGKLWGSRNEIGPISRIELPAVAGSVAQGLLVQNGSKGFVRHSTLQDTSAQPSTLDLGALFAPLAGTDITAFDLQMPFLYWNDFVFEGVAPVRGRPAHVFLMYPPDEICALRPDLNAVRVYLDTQYGALVQAEQIGAEERVLKSITVLDLKKVDDQWMVKTIDVRDDTTRNKTQFVVTGAALGLEFSGMLFDPASLVGKIAPPPAERVRRLGN